VKAVSDVIAPLSGEVIEANEALSGEPGEVNESPYDAGWLGACPSRRPRRGRGAPRADSYRRLVEQ
jgi:glycine cleavage system H protein